ncbi:hypothetical protein BGZ92_003480 [Podila epicladia]|nr:hypothetical protein BGZ92_003480 [Podila epicladia]
MPVRSTIMTRPVAYPHMHSDRSIGDLEAIHLIHSLTLLPIPGTISPQTAHDSLLQLLDAAVEDQNQSSFSVD